MIILQKKPKKNNPYLPQLLDHPYRILLILGSGSRKTSALLNLKKQQDDDDYSVIVLLLRFIYMLRTQISKISTISH